MEWVNRGIGIMARGTPAGGMGRCIGHLLFSLLRFRSAADLTFAQYFRGLSWRMSNPKSRTTIIFGQCPPGSNIRTRVRRNTVRMLDPGHWRIGLLSFSANDRKSVAR